jgi:hypothetical protein
MPGDWIKLRTDLHSDPAVIRLGAILGLDTFAVVGRLAAVWVWADTHADRHGRVTLVSRSCLDSVTQCVGFGDALEAVGWLSSDPGEGVGITFPRFDRHMGGGAKARAQAAKRKQKQREKVSRPGHARVTLVSRLARDTSVTRVEKSREEKSKEEIPPSIPPELDTEEFRRAWGEWKADRAARRIKPYTARGEAAQLKALAAVGPAVAVEAIALSVRSGWQGLFPEKVKRAAPLPPPGRVMTMSDLVAKHTERPAA